MLIADINIGQIISFKDDKRCNFFIYSQIGTTIFSNLYLRLNEKEKIAISNIPLLAYVIYYFACVVSNNYIWLWNSANKSESVINVQKIIIHTMVDLLNTMIEANMGKDKNFQYELIVNRLMHKIKNTYMDMNAYNMIDEQMKQKIRVDSATNKISYVTKKEKIIDLNNNDVEFKPIIHSAVRCLSKEDKLEKVEHTKFDYDIDIFTNCPDGKFHEWDYKNKGIVCNLCGAYYGELIKDKNNFNISFKEVKNYNIKNKNFNIEKSDKERIKQKDESNKIMYKENVDDLNNIKNFLYKTLSDNNTLIISYKNILLDIFNNIDINYINSKINSMLDSDKINVDINTINNQILNIFNITDKDILNNFNLRNRLIYKIDRIYNELNNINTITKNYIDKLNLNIDTYNKQITTFDIDINNFNKEIITTDGKIENLKSVINNIKNKINKFDKQIAAAKLSYKSATNQTEKNKFMLNISNIDQQKIEAENEREKNEEDLLKLEKIKTDVKSKIKNIEDDKKSIIVKITNDKNELNNKETLLKNINVNILNINNKSKLVEIYKYLIDNSKQINIKTEFEYFYNLISNSNSKNNISNLFLAQIITQPLFNKLSTYIENYKKEKSKTNFIFNYNYDEINFNKILNFYQQKLDESNNKIK